MVLHYFKKLIRIIIFPLPLLTSCSKEVSLSTEEKHVVVECILSCDSVQTLKFFYTRAKDSSDDYIFIDQAEVVLFDESKNISVGAFRPVGKEWTLNYAAVPEHSYRLDIDIAGHEHISARQTMPKQVNVYGHITWGAPWSSQSGSHQYGESFCGTTFGINALPAKTWIYALACDENTGEMHIADEICSNYPHIDNFNLTGEAYIPYVIGFETANGILPIPICKYLEGYPLYRRYMRTNAEQLSPLDFEIENFIVCGSFYEYHNPNQEQPLGSKGGIVFTTVSDDYDRYLLEAIHYQQQQEVDDMTTIYRRDNIFSNIKGGIGIFGAKTECMTNWVMKQPYNIN